MIYRLFKIITIALTISLLSINVYSSDVETGFGYSNFPILGIAFDSRPAALANSIAATEFSGAGSSPASEAFISQYTAHISFRKHIIDIMGGSLYFGAPFNNYGVISGSVQYLSLGSFEGELKDAYNNPIDGDINPYAAVFSLNWAKLFKEHYSAGIRFKYLHDKLSDRINSKILGYTIKGIAFDIGFQYRTEKGKINYGILLKNIGTSIHASEELGEIELPTLLSAGIVIKPSRISDTKILFELEKALDAMIKAKVALDVNVYNNQFFLRGGVDAVNVAQRLATKLDVSNEDDYSLTDWSIITLGIGIKSSDKIKRAVVLDASVEIRANGLPPAGNVSILFGI